MSKKIHKKKNNKRRAAPKKKITPRKFLLMALALTVLAGICIWLVVHFSGGCGDKYNKNYKYDGTSLVGKWIDENMDEKSYDVYDFVDSSKVILTTNRYGIETSKTEARYSVSDGNLITVSYEYEDYYTGAIRTQTDYFRFSISKRGKLIIVHLDDMNLTEKERVMKKYDLSFNDTADSIIGTWVSNDDSSIKFVFEPDRSGKTTALNAYSELVEYNLYYSTKGSTLYFIYEHQLGTGLSDTATMCEYKIENNVLIMYGEKDEVIKFTKED